MAHFASPNWLMAFVQSMTVEAASQQSFGQLMSIHWANVLQLLAMPASVQRVLMSFLAAQDPAVPVTAALQHSLAQLASIQDWKFRQLLAKLGSEQRVLISDLAAQGSVEVAAGVGAITPASQHSFGQLADIHTEKVAQLLAKLYSVHLELTSARLEHFPAPAWLAWQHSFAQLASIQVAYVLQFVEKLGSEQRALASVLPAHRSVDPTGVGATAASLSFSSQHSFGQLTSIQPAYTRQLLRGVAENLEFDSAK